MVVNEVYRDKPGWSEGSQCHAKENQQLCEWECDTYTATPLKGQSGH